MNSELIEYKNYNQEILKIIENNDNLIYYILKNNEILSDSFIKLSSFNHNNNNLSELYKLLSQKYSTQIIDNINQNNRISLLTKNNDLLLEKNEIMNENYKILEKKYNQIKENLTCKICFNKKISLILKPCGHTYFCLECYNNLIKYSISNSVKCPICNKLSNGFQSIYLPI